MPSLCEPQTVHPGKKGGSSALQLRTGLSGVSRKAQERSLRTLCPTYARAGEVALQESLVRIPSTSEKLAHSELFSPAESRRAASISPGSRPRSASLPRGGAPGPRRRGVWGLPLSFFPAQLPPLVPAPECVRPRERLSTSPTFLLKERPRPREGGSLYLNVRFPSHTTTLHRFTSFLVLFLPVGTLFIYLSVNALRGSQYHVCPVPLRP